MVNHVGLLNGEVLMFTEGGCSVKCLKFSGTKCHICFRFEIKVENFFLQYKKLIGNVKGHLILHLTHGVWG